MSLDCMTCGACCVPLQSSPHGYAETTWTDERKLGSEFVRLNVLRPKRAGMTAQGLKVPRGALKTVERNGREVCVALQGVVGEKVECSVYDKRPRVCKTSCEPGDAICLAHRKEVGL